MRPFIRRALEASFAACFGIIGGLAASAFLRRGSVAKEVVDAPARSAPISIVVRSGGEAEDPASRAAPPPASSRAAAPPLTEASTSQPRSEAFDPRSLEEQMKEADQFHQLQHEASLRAHGNEPRDTKWASATEQMLQADLAKVSDTGKFKVIGVDCRMTSCVSVLEWSSYEEARRNYAATLRAPFQVNCGQEVLLPPPPNPSAPYQATMVFDCEGWRSGGN